MVWVVVRQASLFSKDGLNFGRYIYIVHFKRFLEDREWGRRIDWVRAGGPDGQGDDFAGLEIPPLKVLIQDLAGQEWGRRN